jgi:uncharacterized protein YutE (UPF0331/DUF86 family)
MEHLLIGLLITFCGLFFCIKALKNPKKFIEKAYSDNSRQRSFIEENNYFWAKVIFRWGIFISLIIVVFSLASIIKILINYLGAEPQRY